VLHGLSLLVSPVLPAHVLLPLPPVFLDLRGCAVHGEYEDAVLPASGLLFLPFYHDLLII